MDINVIKLRDYRAKKGLSRPGLARKAGISRATMFRMEAKGSTKEATIKKVADALEVDIHTLIYGEIQEGEKPADKFEVAEKRDTYNKDTEKGFYGTESPPDPFGQAVADLRDIFNSGDRVLITALLANLYSFKRSAHRETENQTMRTEIDNLKSRLAAVEEKLKGG